MENIILKPYTFVDIFVISTWTMCVCLACPPLLWFLIGFVSLDLEVAVFPHTHKAVEIQEYYTFGSHTTTVWRTTLVCAHY